MSGRYFFRALGLICLVLPFTGCTSNHVNSVSISPADPSVVAGQTVQFTATGVTGQGTGTKNLTDQVAWTSSTTAVATVNSTGLATAVSAGTSTITASLSGTTPATTTITVTGASSSTGTIKSLSIIPSSQSVASPPDTSQFTAIGTTSTGTTVNLTSQAVWSSSAESVATVGASTGLATAVGKGTTTITAIYTDASTQAVVTATATFTVNSGATEQITSLSIIPSSLSLSATGQPGQFIAIGTSGSTGYTEDVTDSPQLKWISSVPDYATIATYPATNAGQAAGVSPGTAPIIAKWTNADSTTVTAQASVSVTTTAAAEPLLSIAIVPTSISTGNLEGTGQFLAYGTFSTTPTLMDITNGFYHQDFPSASCTAALAATGTSPCTLVSVNWISATPDVFPVNSSGAAGATAGLVTAEGSGNAVIYTTATNPDGTLVYSPTVAFNCPYVAYVPATSTTPAVLGSCNSETIASGLLVTLTVYNTGLNTSNWLVTAPSATGTSDVIHCGPGSTSGGSVCTATYPVGTTVTLTAPAKSGVAFGGWSWNCESQGTVTAAGPNSCTVYLGAIDPATSIPSSNVSVGAIFNNAN
jgi:uncharacterized protein YjdB